MQLEALGKHIAQVAPLLGAALAGPGGAAVGHILAAKFGGESQTPEALQAVIARDPDAALKLRQLEADHEVELQKLTLQAATQALQTAQNDRASAREREAAVSRIPLAARDPTPAILAYLLTLGLFTALAFLCCTTIPKANEPLLLGILSSLTTVWVGAMGYYHGSSMGSSLKDAGLVHHLHTTASDRTSE